MFVFFFVHTESTSLSISGYSSKHRNSSESSSKALVSDVPPPSATSARHFELSTLVEEEETKGSSMTSLQRAKEIQLKGSSSDEFDGTILPACTVGIGTFTGASDSIAKKMSVNVGTQTGANSPYTSRTTCITLPNVSKELLYQYVPLPPSTTPTPSASFCSLDNY